MAANAKKPKKPKKPHEPMPDFFIPESVSGQQKK
jgi:hypothetical protein